MSYNELLSLESPDRKSQCSFFPNYGVCLNSLSFSGKEILRSAKSELEFETLTKAAFNGSQLFPFPNRIQNGQYSFEGNTFQLPINDPAAPNSIHGLIYDRPFTIKGEPDQGQLHLEYSYASDDSGYPFEMLIENIIVLSSNYLEVTTKIRNTGNTKAPFGHGWHPYFNGSGNIESCSVQIPGSKTFLTDDNYIPTLKTQEIADFLEKSNIGSTVIDSCFELNESPYSVIFENPIEGFEVGVKSNGYPFLQAYIPPTRDCIALEPQTSIPDAFNNGKGLLILEPGEIQEFSMSIELMT